jgi:uncharacterized membrane protein
MDENTKKYIDGQRAAGKTDEQIKQALLQSGWTQAQVDEVFGAKADSGVTPPPPPNSTPAPSNNSKVFSIISYIWLLWIIPLATGDVKKDPAVKFHVKQGIILTVVWLVTVVVLPFIPILGWIALPIVNVALFVFMILGIINAAQDKQNPLPLIGQFADKINI